LKRSQLAVRVEPGVLGLKAIENLSTCLVRPRREPSPAGGPGRLEGKLFGAMSFDVKAGVAAADALCQSEAAAESLANAGNFRAYLGSAETDALCYILGQTGKVADNCGLPELPDTNPWRRVDDYPIGTAAQLAAGTLTAPLALAADATLMSNERPRTGTELDGATSWNCADWSGSSFYSLAGHPAFITGHWTSHWTTDCDGKETAVYCFEG
jgi:hypothetical protein